MGIEVRMATEMQASYTGISERRNLLTPGFLMDDDDPLILAAAAAVGRRGGEGSAVIRPWTFATDGGWSQGVFGIPTLGFAAGEERFAHTNRERWELEEAEWSFHRHPALILALQKALG
jgi:acetylornithine deacetylase/succinyl-diaminopimelate desuccinylase-like protein